MNDTGMRLEAGSVVALAFYDLGRVVDVDALARGDGAERPQFAANAHGTRYAVAPVEIPLDDVEVPVENGRVFADASVRVFDFGIAAVALRVLVGGMDWDRFNERVEEVSSAFSGRSGVWDEVGRRMRSRIGGAHPVGAEPVGRHLFVIARRFGSAVPLHELVDDDYAASIVSREWLPLTSIERADLLRTARVAGNDLVVIGDERSFIVEATPGSGVPDVIEAALAQRAAYDASLGARDRVAGARVARADAVLSSERGSRLDSIAATARDRFRVAEVAARAGRADSSARFPLAPLVIVAVVTAILTALAVLALS